MIALMGSWQAGGNHGWQQWFHGGFVCGPSFQMKDLRERGLLHAKFVFHGVSYWLNLSKRTDRIQRNWDWGIGSNSEKLMAMCPMNGYVPPPVA
jgi:hypothetical protein